MTNHYYNVFISNDDGSQELSQLTFADLEPGKATDALDIRVYNAESSDININYLAACRIDMIGEQRTDETTTDANSNGLELVEEAWVEARLLETDPWTPLDDWANKLDLGTITAGEYVEAQVRINVPSDATTFGPISFCLAVHSRVSSGDPLIVYWANEEGVDTVYVYNLLTDEFGEITPTVGDVGTGFEITGESLWGGSTLSIVGYPAAGAVGKTMTIGNAYDETPYLGRSDVLDVSGCRTWLEDFFEEDIAFTTADLDEAQEFVSDWSEEICFMTSTGQLGASWLTDGGNLRIQTVGDYDSPDFVRRIGIA